MLRQVDLAGKLNRLLIPLARVRPKIWESTGGARGIRFALRISPDLSQFPEIWDTPARQKGLHYNHADGIIFAVSVYFCQPSRLNVVDTMENSKVLVIDDDPGTCSLLELVLEMENYRPASRKVIEQGDIISLLNQENPDILILDLHLGSEDALKYIRSIRSHPDWQDLLILATSAIDHRRECQEAGTDDFILKPFNWEDLIKKIKNLDHNTA